MSDKWRYQIMQDDQELWSVHEVYYDEENPTIPHSWTEEAVVIAGDTPEEVQQAIFRLVGDAYRAPLSLYWQREKLADLADDATDLGTELADQGGEDVTAKEG